eukprot:Awhi_evm1s14099
MSGRQTRRNAQENLIERSLLRNSKRNKRVFERGIRGRHKVAIESDEEEGEKRTKRQVDSDDEEDLRGKRSKLEVEENDIDNGYVAKREKRSNNKKIIEKEHVFGESPTTYYSDTIVENQQPTTTNKNINHGSVAKIVQQMNAKRSTINDKDENNCQDGKDVVKREKGTNNLHKTDIGNDTENVLTLPSGSVAKIVQKMNDGGGVEKEDIGNGDLNRCIDQIKQKVNELANFKKNKDVEEIQEKIKELEGILQHRQRYEKERYIEALGYRRKIELLEEEATLDLCQKGTCESAKRLSEGMKNLSQSHDKECDWCVVAKGQILELERNYKKLKYASNFGNKVL